MSDTDSGVTLVFNPTRTRRQSSELLPLMRIVVLGPNASENSRVGNFLLGRAAFETEEPPDVVERVGGKHMTVINTPNISLHQMTQRVRECVYLSAPGPHVILLVLKHDQCSREEKECVEMLLNSFSHSVFQHTMMITTQESHTQVNDIIQEIIDKCNNRHFRLERNSTPAQLIEKCEEIVHSNGGQHLISKERDSTESKYVRIVLMGKTGVGKSATANTILGRVAFKAEESSDSVTSECQRETAEINGRHITVIDTPGLFDTELSHEEIQTEITNCISMSLPGPHVFIIVLNIGQRFTQEEAKSVKIIQEMFGENSLMYTMVLFTRGDYLKNKTIEQWLGKPGSIIRNLIEECGNRFHVFNNNETRDHTQVSDLLEKIDAMVTANGGSYYSCKMFRQMERDLQEKQINILKERVETLNREREELLTKHEEEKERMKKMMEEERQNQDKEKKRTENEFYEREEKYKRGIQEKEEHEREMRRQLETLKHEFEEMRREKEKLKTEKENLQIKYDTEIDKMMNRIENERQNHDKEMKRSEEQHTKEMKREQEEWEKQKQEDEKRRVREKQIYEKQNQRLQNEMKEIIREKERIEREKQKQQEQLEESKLKVQKERNMREEQQKTFEAKLKLIEDQHEDEQKKKQAEWREEMKKIWTGTHAAVEVTASRRLETEYSKWTWSLRSAMLEIENTLHNKIENETIHEIQETDLQRELNEKSEEVKILMSEFFEKDTYAVILIQWKASYETKIKELQENFVRDTKRKLNDILQQRHLKKRTDAQKTYHENTLFEISKELALKLKDKANDEETLKKEFDSFWEHCVDEIITDTPPIKDIDILRDVKILLSEIYQSPIDHWTESRDIFSLPSYSDYVQLNKSNGIIRDLKEKFGFVLSSKEFETQIRTLITDIAQQIDKMIMSFNTAKMGYNISCIQQVTDYIKRRVTEHQEGAVNYVFKNEFFMVLVFSICKRANKTFTDQHRLFREANDPVLYMEKKREEYYSIFQKYCKGATSAVIFGEIICQKLKEPIEQSVYKNTAIDLADEMRTNCESLNGNRSKLEKHILKTLAEEGNFDKYINYIHNPKDHFKSFIRDEVSQYITDKFSVSVLPKMMKNMKLLQQKIMEAAHESTEHVKVNSGDVEAAHESTEHVKVNSADVDLWLKCFTQKLSDVLIFSEKDLSGVSRDDVDDFNFLEDVIRKELPSVISDISRTCRTKTVQKRFCLNLDYKYRPADILIDHFCQCCWVQCPFCAAVCTNSIEDHDGDHSVPFHQVSGLSGAQDLRRDFCTTLVTSSDAWFVASHQWFYFKEYRTAGGVYGIWNITPGISELPYWKWFVCRFQKDLEKYYNKTFCGSNEIADEWRKYTKQEAIESLDKYM